MLTKDLNRPVKMPAFGCAATLAAYANDVETIQFLVEHYNVPPTHIHVLAWLTSYGNADTLAWLIARARADEVVGSHGREHPRVCLHSLDNVDILCWLDQSLHDGVSSSLLDRLDIRQAYLSSA
ncbi:Aste57867_14117 [Aphanomyces stellatus]|uniref:Aste57867_14117 protein n=1 Tax=Aphanomyces stellatus TaxID=120398 RepID=A0A485L069_9STRA|nr:hypothetical protein As57867_014066 [Aphanomyces stellatus]VFT90944.1 Aste57867_14117 [Aphanomyces stellatus]